MRPLIIGILLASSLMIGGAPSAPFLELEGRRLLHRATVTVREPHAISLHCVVKGAAPPPVTLVHWFVGEANVTSAAELFVDLSGGTWISRSALPLNATRSLHGREVVCRALDLQGGGAAVSASLNVLYEPSFSIRRSPGFGLPLVEGMRVSLECAVDANPLSPAAWVRDDGPPETTHGAATLTFDPVDKQRHSGWYRCTTHNPAFGFFASFGYFLNVRASDPPGDHSPGCHGVSAVEGGSMVSGVEGGAALLSARLCAPRLPTDRVFWLIRQVALRPGDSAHPYFAHQLTETDAPGCWTAVLQVEPLSPSDSGEVLMLAEGSPRAAAFALNVTPRATPRATAPNAGELSMVMALFLVAAWLIRGAAAHSPSTTCKK